MPDAACSGSPARVTSVPRPVLPSPRTCVRAVPRPQRGQGRGFEVVRLGLLVLAIGCVKKAPPKPAFFTEDFERGELGGQWTDTSGGQGRLEAGKLHVSLAYNHPVWLKQRLPDDVVVDVDVMSKSPSGDIKIELFGDGKSFDPDRGEYNPTGYVFIFGGWNNQLSIIGRLGEHEEGVMVKRTEPKVVPGQSYHWTISRKGGQIDWAIDGEPFLSYTDAQPLTGEGHGFLGITNWQADVFFDNLQLRPAS
jgi:hypothetical protein